MVAGWRAQVIFRGQREPDKYAACASNRFSRVAGEGGRHGRMRGTGPLVYATDRVWE